MTGKSEKIWVVLEHLDDGGINAVAYDNAADADNYALEMTARHGAHERIRILETGLNRREDAPFDDTPWGALWMDIKTEFVEGLMEDMVPVDRIVPGAAERFVTEKTDTVRKRAVSRLDEIVRNEMKDELLHSSDEWIRGKGMED
jgi:hypothetical protein